MDRLDLLYNHSMGLTITLRPDTEAALRREAAERGLAAEELAAQRVEESELIRQIRELSRPLSASAQHRYNILRQRNKRENLTDEERRDLQAFTTDEERRWAERLEKLIALSHLQNLPVKTVAAELGIRRHIV